MVQAEPEVIRRALLGMPVLLIGAWPQELSDWLSDAGHFIFAMESDPSCPVLHRHDKAVIRKAIVTKAKYGVRAFDNHGQTITIPAITLADLSQQIGIEQWGAICMNDEDADGVLGELPGPLAQVLLVTTPLSALTERHINQWYRAFHGAWILRGLA